MEFTNTEIHAAQDLLYALQNPKLEIPLSTLENSHTADIRELAEKNKATPGARPPRVVPPEIKRQNQLLI